MARALAIGLVLAVLAAVVLVARRSQLTDESSAPHSPDDTPASS